MGCWKVLIKFSLYILNIFTMLCGILLIIFGSLMVSHMRRIDFHHKAFVLNSVPIIILVLGCIAFLVFFMGCCGLITESSYCILKYSMVMLVLCACKLALIIYVWTQRDQILKDTEQAVQEIWEQHKTDQNSMDQLQLTFNCCGSNSFVDYGCVPIPLSCCGPSASSCGRTASCGPNYWAKNTNIIRYAGLVVVLDELVVFCFACCLFIQLRNKLTQSRQTIHYKWFKNQKPELAQTS